MQLIHLTGFPYDLTGQARCIASGRELRARWSSVIYVAKVSCRDADFPDPGQDQESGVADHRRQTAAGGLGVLALRRDLPGCGAEDGEGGGGPDEAARAASSGRERRTRSGGGLRSRSGRDDGLDVGETFGGRNRGLVGRGAGHGRTVGACLGGGSRPPRRSMATHALMSCRRQSRSRQTSRDNARRVRVPFPIKARTVSSSSSEKSRPQ